MKTIGLLTAISIAISTWAVPATADPWKDESGHGRWIKRHEFKEKHWKPKRHYYRDQHERHGYWNGHRGYRGYRRGYRRHDDGWWYPLAAFGAGVIVGGDIARPAPAYRPAPVTRSAGSAHEQWCYSRYRSYRAYDNTFQPYYGPRKECISPYY